MEILTDVGVSPAALRNTQPGAPTSDLALPATSAPARAMPACCTGIGLAQPDDLRLPKDMLANLKPLNAAGKR